MAGLSDPVFCDGVLFVVLFCVVAFLSCMEACAVHALRRQRVWLACKNGEHCPICLMPLVWRGCGGATGLSCGHVFHGACVRTWWAAAKCPHCPLCRHTDIDDCVASV
jgi:hypothetical protein